MSSGLAQLDTPCVVIDEARVRRNISRMQSYCDKLGLAFRPHIKTHKLPELAQAQLQAGACGINCQKIGEAEVMAAAGFEDILISYNIVGAVKIARLRTLASRVKRLTVTVDSVEVATALAGGSDPINVLVECDTGHRRCGVLSPAAAVQLAAQISSRPGLSFGGLLTYPAIGGQKEAELFFREASESCAAAGLPCSVVSTGGTPDWRLVERYQSITEFRAGTYVYNDREMLQAGACAIEDCALTVLATVVSALEPGRIIIDAGSKTLTSDLLGCTGYGEVVGRPDAVVELLSEEHGTIRQPLSAESMHVGQRLRIIPNHACPVSNLVDYVWMLAEGQPPRRVSVAARGCSL